MIKERRKKLERLRAIRRIQRNKRLKVWIKPLLIVGFITVILSSCLWVFSHMGDPVQNLQFTNRKNATATVILETNNPQSSFLKQPVKNYILGQGHRDGLLLFGIGSWSDGEIAHVGSQIDKITLITADKTTIYDKPEQIMHLLKTNWEKSGKENTIEIEVE